MREAFAAGGFKGGGGGGNQFREEDHPRNHGKFRDKGGGKPGGGDKGKSADPSGGKDAAGADGKNGKGGKAQASLARPGFHRATDEERKALRIPPAYTDVHVADDPKAPLQAVCRNKHGDIVRKYSAEHEEEALAEKFERGRLLQAAMPGIVHHLQRERDEGGKHAESALALQVIIHTGARIGGDTSPHAKKQSYGTSTLEARHVRIEGDTVILDFVGKSGVRNHYQFEDHHIAEELRRRKEAAGKAHRTKLFRTSDDKIRKALHAAGSGQEFKVHDLRTWKATDTAIAALEQIEPPRSAEEYWEKRDEVGQAAARQINDTVAVALKHYVAPHIFEGWRTEAGVPHDAERPKRARAARQQ